MCLPLICPPDPTPEQKPRYDCLRANVICPGFVRVPLMEK
jgi:hypothetical protein